MGNSFLKNKERKPLWHELSHVPKLEGLNVVGNQHDKSLFGLPLLQTGGGEEGGLNVFHHEHKDIEPSVSTEELFWLNTPTIQTLTLEFSKKKWCPFQKEETHFTLWEINLTNFGQWHHLGVKTIKRLGLYVSVWERVKETFIFTVCMASGEEVRDLFSHFEYF